MKVLLVIGGSIAAYKTLDLIRLLFERQHNITCIMSDSSTKFITPLSVSALTGNLVYTNKDYWGIEESMLHIKLVKDIDVVLVAPATANIIAKAAAGIVDELSTIIFITTKSPIVLAPAMNPTMWSSKVIQRNVEILKNDGIHFIEPLEGFMACGEYGIGKMANVEAIVSFLEKINL